MEGFTMVISTETKVAWNQPRIVTVPRRQPDQKQRIRDALGSTNEWLPAVDETTLGQYYRYLAANLTLPFTAHFPKPTTSAEQSEFRCTVVSLIDPTKYLGDGFDGIFCTTRKGEYDLNLPLIDLYLPENSKNFQLIKDYWFWFWNWR
jgi:hypothetical protein